MKILQRVLPSLTLLEWGVILTYFYFSGRIASFLHPMFRPWVLVTGVLLVLTAIVVGFFPEETCDHEHEQEHDRLTVGSVIAFFLLLIPFALAAKISPDSYGADLIRRRGLVEDIRALPGITRYSTSLSRPSEATNSPAAPLSLPEQATLMQKLINNTSAVAAKEPPRVAPKVGTLIGVPEAEEPLPSNDDTPGRETQDVPPPPIDPGVYQNEFLKPDESGNIKVQVTDLLYAAQEVSTRKDFEGKRVEIVGQFLALKRKGGAPLPTRVASFKLLRLVMVCCAADMMPAAIQIETKTRPPLREMGWVKVIGRLHYRPRPKGPSPDGIDYGDFPEPIIVAEAITKTATPSEKYLY